MDLCWRKKVGTLRDFPLVIELFCFAFGHFKEAAENLARVQMEKNSAIHRLQQLLNSKDLEMQVLSKFLTSIPNLAISSRVFCIHVW